MTTTILPRGIREIILTRGLELEQYKVCSLFCYDRDAHVVNIFTDWPGIWIGVSGVDIRNLLNQCRSIDPEIEINIVECTR